MLSLALLDACLQDALSVLLKLGGYIILFAVLSNVITHIPRIRAESAAFSPAFWKLQAESLPSLPHLLIRKVSCDIAPVSGFWRSLLFHAKQGVS